MDRVEIYYIERLINAFYEGETTPDDEKKLEEYFLKENIAEHLFAEKEIFIRLHSAKVNFVPKDLPLKLDSLIDRLEMESKSQQSVRLKIRRTRNHSLKTITGIAAAVLLVLSLSVFTYKAISPSETALSDTFSNTEDAYVETQKVLLLVSNKLNKGFEQMETIERSIDKTNKIIQENRN